MHAEGEFQFSNGCLIDSSLKSDRITSVALHETLHAELYTTTSYGQLTIMLEKNFLFYDKCKWMYNALFSYMNRMQERIAVNIETLDIFNKEGFDNYNSAILNLKNRNNSYYNYFRKLCCINGKVNTKEKSNNAMTIIKVLGHIALNLKINEIPFEKFQNNKDLQNFFNISENAVKYSPNKRFDILVDWLFRTTKYEHVINEVFTSTIEDNSLEYIHNLAFNTAKKILYTSPMADRLIQRISTVSTRNISINCENPQYLTALPIDFSISKKCEYSFLTLNEFLKQILDIKNKDYTISLPHQIGGFEDLFFINLFDNDKKINYCTVLNDQTIFLTTLKKIEQPLVFIQTKLFRKLKHCIRGVAHTLPIYIFIDSPIYNSLDFLAKNFKNGQYSYYNNNGNLILIIWRGSYVFLCMIIELAIKELLNFFNELNISYLEFSASPLNQSALKKIVDSCIENMILSKNYTDSQRN